MTEFGTWMPNLCVVIQYFDLTLEMILFIRLSTYFAHQLKEVYFSILLPVSNYNTFIGLDLLRSFNEAQFLDTSLH